MLFGKKKASKDSDKQQELTELANSLPNKKIVQFCYVKPKDLNAKLEEDINAVLNLEPSNYYESKTKFYDCIFYYDEVYTRILMQLVLIENDKKNYSSNFYPVDFAFFSQVLGMFGQRITF